MNLNRLLPYAFIVGIAHILSGLTIVLEPQSGHVTPLANLTIIFSLFGLWGIFLMGWLLVLVGGVAVWASLLAPTKGAALIAITPQQIVISTHVLSVLGALAVGTYPDGYAPEGGALFILADQIWLLLASGMHMLEWLWLALLSRLKNGRNANAIKNR